MIEYLTVQISSIKAVTEFTQIHLQVFCAGPVVGSIQECFGVAYDGVQPKQMLGIRIKIF